MLHENVYHFQYFLPTTKVKEIHDFLEHYDNGKFDSSEERPIYISQRGNILTYEISVKKYKYYHDFENSEELVNDFLKKVRSRFKVGRFVVMRCGFSIENYQPGPTENDTPIFTEPYRTKLFNDYILVS